MRRHTSLAQFIPLFQERLCADKVLADRGGLPAEIGAGGIDLVELGLAVLHSRHKERHPKRPHTTAS